MVISTHLFQYQLTHYHAHWFLSAFVHVTENQGGSPAAVHRSTKIPRLHKPGSALRRAAGLTEAGLANAASRLPKTRFPAIWTHPVRPS